MTVHEMRQKLTAMSKNLQVWSRDTFGSVRKEIKLMQQELKRLRDDPVRTGPNHLELKINKKLVELYHREEIMWRQRARVQWLAARDKNTRFFHLRASLRQKKNMIRALQNSLGVLVEDPVELKVLANEFYQDLYTSEGVHDMEAVLQHVPRKVTAGMNANLCAPYTSDEVNTALFQMFPTKAPGPDGFPAHFYQHHWDICGEEVTRVVLRIVRRGRKPREHQ